MNYSEVIISMSIIFIMRNFIKTTKPYYYSTDIQKYKLIQ